MSDSLRRRQDYDRRMNVNRSLHVHVIALVFLCFTPPPLARAQDALTDIKRELTALRAEVQQLREQVEALKAAPAAEAATPAALELLNSQVAELAQTRVESTSRLPVKLFGTVHADFFTNSANPNWLDIPNLVMPPPADGSTGSMSATLRQTRVGFTIDAPRMGSFRTSGVVALDFFGGIPAFQTAQVIGLPRLVAAYARLDGDRTALEVGQDHVILAPRDPTSIAAFAFPCCFDPGTSICAHPRQGSSTRSFPACARSPALLRRSLVTSPVRITCSCHRLSAANGLAVQVCRRGSLTRLRGRPMRRACSTLESRAISGGSAAVPCARGAGRERWISPRAGTW